MVVSPLLALPLSTLLHKNSIGLYYPRTQLDGPGRSSMFPGSYFRAVLAVGCAFLVAVLFAESLTTASAATTETGRPLFRYAMFATSNTCGAIVLTSSRTDSFDSSMGTYAATRQDSAGNIGTNGNSN